MKKFYCSQKKYLSFTVGKIVLLGMILSYVHAGHASEASWKISSGVDYSSGDYGDSVDTDIVYLPVSLSVARGAWSAKVTASWVEIDGPGNVVGAGDGGIVVGDRGGESSTESGIGDTWVSLSYSVADLPQQFGYLDVTGKVKIPTADEDDGLGTGETDYTLQLDLYKPYDKLTPMVTAAYKIKGEPAGSSIDNVWYLSGGADYRYNQTINFGATLDFQEASTNGADDALELFTYFGYRFSERWSATVYSYFGFSDGSPDEGIGLQLTYRM
jgi:hypothetical protein